MLVQLIFLLLSQTWCTCLKLLHGIQLKQDMALLKTTRFNISLSKFRKNCLKIWLLILTQIHLSKTFISILSWWNPKAWDNLWLNVPLVKHASLILIKLIKTMICWVILVKSWTDKQCSTSLDLVKQIHSKQEEYVVISFSNRN